MRNRLQKIVMGLAASSAMTLSGLAALPGAVALSGNVPAAVARLQPAGQLPATQQMRLAIGLPLRNQAALTNLLRQLYDPASPNYRHFLTSDEFTAQFGPTEQDYQKVISFAQASGLTVTQTHSNRVLVDVTGSVTDIQKAFGVTLRTYPHPAETRSFFAPDAPPSVPSDVPVLHVSGLDNYVVPRPLLHKSQAKPALGSGPGGSYLGSDFRNAYVPGTTLDGSGQMVGLLQFDSGFFQSDITAYETLAGLPNVPVEAVLLNGYNGGPGIGNDEVSLDIEMVISMAPGVSKIYVYEGSLTDDILSAMAANSQVKQLSASWSYGIDSVSELLFLQFAAQGQSFFNASGDSDSWAGFGSVDTPSDDPYITIVGGTTLSTVNNAWASETVWNWGVSRGSAYDGIGSGGGISTIYPIPSWQTNIDMRANKGSTTRRNLPDVALTADNIWVIYGGGASGSFGGTSAATPLWAGFMALVNQQAVANQRSTIGFLNPTLYPLAKGTNYSNLFHDITTGNNRWSASPNLFDAVPGYDLCTGWGTPNGTNLIAALAGAPVLPVSAPPPPYGSALSALNGSNPNGTWELFVQDDAEADTGVNSNGWILNLTLASPVVGAADNQLLMTTLATNVPFGSNIVFVLSVTNYGPSPSTNVLVADTLPAGATVVSAVPTKGSVNGTLWSVGPLATNQGAALTLTVHPAASGAFVNSAFVSASTPDPNPDDVFASATVTVGSGAPPALTNAVVMAGGNFQFTVNGQSGQEYIVQASTNLLIWLPVYTNPPPFVSPFTFTESNMTAYPDRFYRVITGP